MNLFKMPRIGLALGGGSAKGLAHIGVIKVFEEEGIPIDVIAGTSIGSIVGGLYALNPDPLYLENRARVLVNSDAFKDLRLDKFNRNQSGGWFGRIKSRLKDGLTVAESLMKPSIVAKEPTERVFKELFGDKEFSDTRIPFACISLDLLSGNDVIFTTGPLWKATMASSAIPGIFPKVEFENYVLVDGGVTANVPIQAARALGADIVIGVILGRQLSPPGDLSSALEVILRSDELAKFKLFRLTLEEADFIIDIELPDIHWTEFGRIDELIQRGEAAARSALEGVRKITKGRGFFSRLFRR